jgi:hypothetical protein
LYLLVETAPVKEEKEKGRVEGERETLNHGERCSSAMGTYLVGRSQALLL